MRFTKLCLALAVVLVLIMPSTVGAQQTHMPDSFALEDVFDSPPAMLEALDPINVTATGDTGSESLYMTGMQIRHGLAGNMEDSRALVYLNERFNMDNGELLLEPMSRDVAAFSAQILNDESTNRSPMFKAAVAAASAAASGLAWRQWGASDEHRNLTTGFAAGAGGLLALYLTF